MRNLKKWPVWVSLVPVRTLSVTHYLSVRKLAGQTVCILFCAVKKGTHKFANWDPIARNGIVLIIPIHALISCHQSLFLNRDWVKLMCTHWDRQYDPRNPNARTEINAKCQCAQWNLSFNPNARTGTLSPYSNTQTEITVNEQIPWNNCLAHSVSEKGVRVTNDLPKLVFANFGITLWGQGLTA